MNCGEARETIQDRLDGPVEAGRDRRLRQHLEGCGSCREYRRSMDEVRQALRDLPRQRFPDDALEQVWDATIRERPQAVGAPRWWVPDWRAAVAAGVLLAALAGFWVGRGRVAPTGADTPLVAAEPTREELARAEAEIRLVLGRTAAALRQAEQAVVRDVLRGEVSPALRKVPIRWPAEPDRGWRNGT